jgi:hypothetical protein
MASAAEPWGGQLLDKAVETAAEDLTPMAMVFIPILEHIELSLATAPLLPRELDFPRMTS